MVRFFSVSQSVCTTVPVFCTATATTELQHCHRTMSNDLEVRYEEESTSLRDGSESRVSRDGSTLIFSTAFLHHFFSPIFSWIWLKETGLNSISEDSDSDDGIDMMMAELPNQRCTASLSSPPLFLFSLSPFFSFFSLSLLRFGSIPQRDSTTLRVCSKAMVATIIHVCSMQLGVLGQWGQERRRKMKKKRKHTQTKRAIIKA